MKRSKLMLGLTVLLIGLLVSACGANEVNDQMPNDGNNNAANEEMPTGENIGNEPEDDGENLPSDPIGEGPIINLPGEIPYQDIEREPGQGKLSPGSAYVSLVDLLVMESYPVQVSLQISGELPTPCNQLTIDIAEPNAENQIHVEVYSLVDPAMTCMAVIEPFATNVSLPLDNLADGTYEVWVNGTLVGEFNYPG